MKKVDFEYEIVKHEFFFYSQLSERGRRQYAALKAMESGYNGVSLMSEKFSIHKHTIRWVLKFDFSGFAEQKNPILAQCVPMIVKISEYIARFRYISFFL